MLVSILHDEQPRLIANRNCFDLIIVLPNRVNLMDVKYADIAKQIFNMGDDADRFAGVALYGLSPAQGRCDRHINFSPERDPPSGGLFCFAAENCLAEETDGTDGRPESIPSHCGTVHIV